MLLMDGIIPEKVDTTNSFYILTSPIETKTSHVKLSFIAIQQADSVLVLTSGQLNTNIEITLYGVTSTSTWTKINYSGMKGSPIRDAWEYMHEKTTRIPSRSTRYATK